MTNITINLSSKWIFFGASGLGLIYLIFYINYLTSSIHITGLDKLGFFLIMIFIAAAFWTPYQFNDKFY